MGRDALDRRTASDQEAWIIGNTLPSQAARGWDSARGQVLPPARVQVNRQGEAFDSHIWKYAHDSKKIRLVINAIKFQPCQPSLFSARDAIVQVDKILTGGENKCEIWAGCAERGLGRDASVESRQLWGIFGRESGFKAPSSCAKKMN